MEHPDGYIGSARCGECHDRIYYTWKGTKHPYQISLPSRMSVVGDFVRNNTLEVKTDDSIKTIAKMSLRDGKYYISAFPDEKEMKEYEIAYTVGGIRKQNYLARFPNGALHILPVQWNVKTGEWIDYHGLQSHVPGDGSYWSDPGRTWQKKCAKCHVTGFKDHVKDGMYHSMWVDNGIGCEACHGPGANHVRMGKPEKPGTIFTPENFHDDRRANMICGRCHSRGKSPEGSYEYPDTYKTGDELSFHFYEVSETDTERFWPDGTSKSHQQQFIDFRKSVMYEKGVKCWSCHDPHKASAGNGAGLRLSGNVLCRTCHSKNEGNNLTHSIHDNGNCIACHLPRVVKSANDGDMAAHTFFAIPPTATRKFGDGDVKKQPNSCSLCHYHKNTPLEDLIKAYEDKHKEFPTYKSAGNSRVQGSIADRAGEP